jgi:hypothetical protein
MSIRTLPISGTYCATSPIGGHGIFAGRTFREGERIFTLRGPILTLEEVLKKGALHVNAYQIDIDRYVYPGHIESRFINHSCEPNAGLREDRDMIALRDIEMEEEICFDYSTCTSEQLWTMPCQCGATSCRQTIGDFHDLPAALQERYLSRGVVQRFIIREIFERATRLVDRKDVPSAQWASLASRIVPLAAALERRVPSVA